MRKLTVAILAVAAFGLVEATPAQACGDSNDSKTARQKAPKSASMVVMAVDGMSCGACAAKIASELRGVQGVYVAKVDLKTKRATIKYASKKVTVAKLLKTIRELGYKADVVKRS